MTDADQRILKLIERCRRLGRFLEMNAPDRVIEEERRLVKESLAECSPDEVAQTMRSYQQAVQRMDDIEAEVETENPVYPEG